MKSNLPRNRSTPQVVLESSVTQTLTAMMDREPVGLQAAGLDPAALVLGLLGVQSPVVSLGSAAVFGDPCALFPEAAKRKVVEEDEDADDGDDDDDDVDDDEEEDEDEVEEDEDLDEDEDEEEEDDDEDDEDEEDDEFDDPDDDDDYDDDDDDDDFDDDE